MNSRPIIYAMGMEMKYRVDLDFVGAGNAAKAYGGKLAAWSFLDVKPEEWFLAFKQRIVDAMGKEYLPIYRMADGEYRFLMGRQYNFHRKPLIKEIIAVTAEKIRWNDPDKWATSWGEEYTPEETKKLRNELIDNIRFIASHGCLACYINDNGLEAFTEYNKFVQPYFAKHDVVFNSQNYIPFHFVAGILINDGWQVFYQNRNLLVITGSDDASEAKIRETLQRLGAKTVQFIRISKTSSMKDRLDLSQVEITIDLCLVAAGIGSANILRQLEPLNTVALDIGGYMNCLIDNSRTQHGGVFRVPSS